MALSQQREFQQITLTGPFRSRGRHGWSANLPTSLSSDADRDTDEVRSRWQLLEDGVPLGPPHALHAQILELGEGRFSHWSDGTDCMVLFATSDNTDPNANGRQYSFVWDPDAQPVGDYWEPPAQVLRCAVVGVGNRGVHLARMARDLEGVEIAWIVDISSDRAAFAMEQSGATDARLTSDFMEPLRDPEVDVIFITVPDHLHRQVAEPAFQAGKHVYLEKPVATTVDDTRAIISAWQQSGRMLQLGYVLRQAPFYVAVREAVRSGTLGAVRLAALTEQLDVVHGGSFMRRWHSHSTHSGGLMVHKGCHDLDLVCWLFDSHPRRVSSFGGLDLFRGPAPAPFCSQCERQRSCPYVDNGRHERRPPIEAGDPTRYQLDRCVFREDKDIVDNQVVSFELASGVRGSYHLAMQGPRTERRISLYGDAARLDGVFEDGRFTVTFADPQKAPLVWSANGTDVGSHGGGDRRTVREFLNACAGRAPCPIESPQELLTGVLFATAAEAARKTNRVLEFSDADYQVGEAPIDSRRQSAAEPLPTPFAQEGAFCWLAELPETLVALCDNETAHRRSPLRLLENGIELGSAHSDHDAIRTIGGGRYSFWKGNLYFAASDNSNPNQNGRHYTVAASPEHAGK